MPRQRAHATIDAHATLDHRADLQRSSQCRGARSSCRGPRRRGIDAEIIFVDDSTDDTPDVIREVAASAALPVRLIHREHRTGGLGGAVLEGFAAAAADACLVMDGDLQHPPEEIRGSVRAVRARRCRCRDRLALRRRRHVGGPRRSHARPGLEGLDRADAGDVPDPAQGRHRSDDRILPHRPPGGGCRLPASRAASRSCSRSSRARTCASPRCRSTSPAATRASRRRRCGRGCTSSRS